MTGSDGNKKLIQDVDWECCLLALKKKRQFPNLIKHVFLKKALIKIMLNNEILEFQLNKKIK